MHFIWLISSTRRATDTIHIQSHDCTRSATESRDTISQGIICRVWCCGSNRRLPARPPSLCPRNLECCAAPHAPRSRTHLVSYRFTTSRG
eukprot:5328154-Prymnesium_polylepis.2